LSELGKKYGGRYQIAGKLGSGGMAEVFLARDDLLGRNVALKILHANYANDGVFIERFRREAQAAASLNEPRIVSVFDWGSDDGTYYLVMEYVDGRNLRQIITEEGPLLPDRAVEIAIDVCAGLHFAHQHGIIHRDVKPANIHITERGQTKVMDFGIARAAAEDGQTVTKTGTVMGTAAYLSPEQAQGLDVDPRSDVYSAGIVLYEMLTGDVPFKADTPVAVAYKQVKENATPPSRVNPDVPQALDDVVMRALAKDPKHRYQSADEMKLDLERVVRGEAIDAAPLLSDATAAVPIADSTTVLPVEPVDVSPGRKALAYTLIVLTFLGILVALVALLFSLLGPKGATVDVPSVIGMDFEAAEARLSGHGLIAVDGGEDFHDTIAAGFVISQSPGAGEKARENTPVSLVISKGPETIEVPNVVGAREEDARKILEDLDLEVTVSREFSEEVEEGLVISQNPEATTAVSRGSTVELVVSGGEVIVTVPNVTGITEQRAREILTERGLKTAVTEVCNTGERHNRVLDQNPAPREEVPEGSTVTLTVNRAPAIPNVEGETQADATEELEEAGFNVEVEEEATPQPNDNGRVIDQDPSSGTQACRDDTVTITVAT
jgi:serine/threonine-protein kinase